ncbi:MAG: GspMb/PilO family protein [Candidatus Acidiferrales bacterium]
MSDKRFSVIGWKALALIGLGALLLADLGLGVFLWRLRQSDPIELRRQRTELETRAKLLKADVARGQEIQKDMPSVGKEAEKFYHDDLPPGSAGYSALVGDLGEIASKAGLKTSTAGFHEKDLEGRGVSEIEIDEVVEGDYPQVLQFIQGLERSKNFYLLDELALEPETSGGLRLRLSLKTYFRS